jgi:predicted ferric reductase
METYPSGYLAFEILIHLMEALLVIGLALTIFSLKKLKKRKKKNDS